MRIYRNRYWVWEKGKDNLISYFKRGISNTYSMWPRVKVYGIRYLISYEYRVSVKKKLLKKKRKTIYGSGFLSRRKKVVQQLMTRDGAWCRECYNPNIKLTIDHIIPAAAGGTNSLLNLQLLCEKCHVKKGREEDSKRFAKSSQAKVEWNKPERCGTQV